MAGINECAASPQDCIPSDNPDSLSTATAHANFGHARRALQDREGALRSYENALRIRRNALGEGALKVANARHWVGVALMMARNATDNTGPSSADVERAVENLSEALRVRRRKLGDGHIDTADSSYHLGLALAASGQEDEAITSLYGALAVRNAVFGWIHESVVESLDALGGAYLKFERHADAVETLEYSLAVRLELHGKYAEETINAHMELGRAYSCAGDHDEAQKHNVIGLTTMAFLRKTEDSQICVKDCWMSNTRMHQYLQLFQSLFDHSPNLLDACTEPGPSMDIIERLARRAELKDARDALCALWDAGDSVRPRHPNVILAYLLVLRFCEVEGCVALIEQLSDLVYRCQSAKKQAYNLVIQHSAKSYERQQSTTKLENDPFETKWDVLFPNSTKVWEGQLTDPISAPADSGINFLQDQCVRNASAGSLKKIHSMVEDYLDEHKTKALKSSLCEPARFYFDLCGNSSHRDHVNIHGINGWLCLVRGWLGCQIPMVPLSSDEDTFKGCADIWSGLSEDAWSLFQRKENFGKNFEGIKELTSRFLEDDRFGSFFGGLSFVGKNAQDLERAARRQERKYQQYANKFGFFFTKQFLVKRMFEVLNAESKPEHVGFKKACEVLFPTFRDDYNIDEENLIEFVYDDNLMHMDVDRAALFFSWCGVCKQTDNAVVTTKNNDDSGNVCPICFENKSNIILIPHWESRGNISSHRMCRDCMEKYSKNDCPFCHEVSLKDALISLINDFIHDIRIKSSGGDPHKLAALTEQWQGIEMEYGGNPNVLHRIARLVLQDVNFAALLHDGVASKAGWLRDAAGFIFRLYAMCLEGDLDVTVFEERLLQNCYRTIIETITNDPNIHGHYYGAIYSQAMAPYVCALRNGQKTGQLGIIVKEIGSLIVRLHDKRKVSSPRHRSTVRQRIVEDYMPIISSSVWGTESNDPVWKAFFAEEC